MSKPKIISIPQLGAIANALEDLTRTLRGGKEKENDIASTSPDEGNEAEEHVKYLEEKLERYEEAVFNIIRPLMHAGVPAEVIRTIIDGKSRVSVFYDKNQLGRSHQKVGMEFTALDVEGEKQ